MADARLGHVAYRGKLGCTNPYCTTKGDMDSCYGWHCAKCDRPSNCQGDCSHCDKPVSATIS